MPHLWPHLSFHSRPFLHPSFCTSIYCWLQGWPHDVCRGPSNASWPARWCPCTDHRRWPFCAHSSKPPKLVHCEFEQSHFLEHILEPAKVLGTKLVQESAFLEGPLRQFLVFPASHCGERCPPGNACFFDLASWPGWPRWHILLLRFELVPFARCPILPNFVSQSELAMLEAGGNHVPKVQDFAPPLFLPSRIHQLVQPWHLSICIATKGELVLLQLVRAFFVLSSFMSDQCCLMPSP